MFLILHVVKKRVHAFCFCTDFLFLFFILEGNSSLNPRFIKPKYPNETAEEAERKSAVGG